MSSTDTPTIHKGLDGVYVDTSAISKVMPDTNSLTYRGFAVQDLVEACSYEEVVYLIWNGELPTQAQLDAFIQEERAQRALTDAHLALIASYAPESHPMDSLRTSVSYLATQMLLKPGKELEQNHAHALTLLAKIPTIIAADYRARKGQAPVAPRADLGMAANFLYMVFGEEQDETMVNGFNGAMILYAEHGFNASTFASRVITSTLSDVNSAVAGAIGALKGSLHGGANEAVLYMLQEIGPSANAEAWLRQALAEKRTIMGFGHRVYKSGDSRVPVMRPYLEKTAKLSGHEDMLETMTILERIMRDEKNIHPNVDYIIGPIYYMMGLEIEFYTPLFAMARTAGWTAHALEQMANNRLIRPLSTYEGPMQRVVTPISERG